MKIIFSFMLLCFPILQTVHAVEYNGTIYFAKRVELGLPTSGEIQHIFVNEGDIVDTGKNLLELDETAFLTSISEAESRAVESETKNTEAVRDLQQAQELYDRTVLSNVDLENIQHNALRSAAKLKMVNAQLLQAKHNYKKSKLVAPYKGIVIELHAHQGQQVANTLSAQPLITFASYGHYIVSILVPLSTVNSINLKQVGRVKLNNKNINAKVKFIKPEPVKNQQTNGPYYEIILEFRLSKLLYTGQTVKVEFS